MSELRSDALFTPVAFGSLLGPLPLPPDPRRKPLLQNLFTDCGLRWIAYPISLHFVVLICFSNVLHLSVDESGLAVRNFDQFNRENGAKIWRLEKFCTHDCASDCPLGKI